MINNITMVQKQLVILLPKSVLTKTNDTSQLNQLHL